MKSLCVLCVLCGFASAAWALEREAFTITKYDLEIHLEPEQQRLGARGKITLRNDSAHPKKVVALQISSSLNWRSIRVDGKTVQFVSQPYTSDIDHTGALSEAIVTLPVELKPKDSVEVEIGYEGVIPLDATRLSSGRSAGGNRQAYKLGPDQSLVHGGAGRWVCGVVSDYNRVGGFFGGEQSVRSGRPLEGAGGGKRIEG